MDLGNLGRKRDAQPSGTDGLGVTDVLGLPEEERRLINWLTRQVEVTLADTIEFSGRNEEECLALMESLVERGFVTKRETEGEPLFRTRYAAKKGRQLPDAVWDALDERATRETRPTGESTQA